jgi:hypothetical protein
MPLFRRRPLLRAAAVGGGAYAFGKHWQRKEEEDRGELGTLHDQGVLTDEEFAKQKANILGL